MAKATPKVDLSEFYRLSTNSKRKPCQIRLILDGEVTPALSTAEVGQLEAALATDAGIITAGAVVQWLATRGHDTNTNRVSNHRRGVCRCAQGD